jgi:hypothetical protein
LILAGVVVKIRWKTLRKGSLHFFELTLAAVVTFFTFADEEFVVVRTRPLELDSALEDELRLRIL